MITDEYFAKRQLEESLRVPNKSVWRHVKKGTRYSVMCLGNSVATLEVEVIYFSLDTGIIWIRPIDEFLDGRFERVSE